MRFEERKFEFNFSSDNGVLKIDCKLYLFLKHIFVIFLLEYNLSILSFFFFF